jgi:hypothetical protein
MACDDLPLGAIANEYVRNVPSKPVLTSLVAISHTFPGLHNGRIYVYSHSSVVDDVLQGLAAARPKLRELGDFVGPCVIRPTTPVGREDSLDEVYITVDIGLPPRPIKL